MKYVLYLILFIFFTVNLKAQYFISELSLLSDSIKETSGLIYFDNRLITHNDSGDDANLYEIDTLTGSVIRTVFINNASNIDWEDICQDSNYIYIADIGNNNGNRQDLKIYRVAKSDYLNNDTVNAETISFTYSNQTDFTVNYNDNEFDAEAISVYKDSLIIFMKDWVNKKTRTYFLPKIPGNYIAYQKDTFDCQGLITGSEFVEEDTSFVLCGYSPTLYPFIIKIKDFSDTNIFDGNILKMELADSIGAAQMEGICFNENSFILSSEKFTYQSYVINSKLFSFSFDYDYNGISIIEKMDLVCFPNPVSNFLNVNNDFEIIGISDVYGNKIDVFIDTNKIDVSNLVPGIYFLRIKKGSKIKVIKFIKNV